MRRIAVFGNDSQDEYLSRLEAFFRIVRHEDVSVGIESGFGSYREENGVETYGMEFVDAFRKTPILWSVSAAMARFCVRRPGWVTGALP